MSLHPGTATYNPAGNSDFTRKVEALALGITQVQAMQWPTPAAQNWKGSSPASVTRADGKSRMDILHYRAEQGFTHPAQVITQHGRRSLPQPHPRAQDQRARLLPDAGGNPVRKRPPVLNSPDINSSMKRLVN